MNRWPGNKLAGKEMSQRASEQTSKQAGAIVSIECVGLDLVAWRENDFHAMLRVVFG